MRRTITYPTADRLRTRERYDHGSPADRLARAYVVETRWIKGLTSVGYGHFSIRSIYYQAHRLLYILRFGHDIPDGLFPDHLCRNRWCVNPDHLEPVTHAENVRRGAGARLTPAIVIAIRAAVTAGRSQRAVGRIYGVEHSMVSRIVRRERWGDIPDKSALTPEVAA